MLLRHLALILFLLAMVGVRAQSAQELERLSADLCGCVQALDPRSPDARLQAGVRRCLEDAVVYHPATVSALLKRDRTQADRAVRVGRVIGALLDRDCPHFGPIKARLRTLDNAGRIRPSM